MILEQFNLAGKVAIVTGASRGLGAGMAIGLAEAGADLVVVASSARLQETVEKIKALGRRCLGIQADLIDTKVIPQIVDATLFRQKLDPLGRMEAVPSDQFTS